MRTKYDILISLLTGSSVCTNGDFQSSSVTEKLALQSIEGVQTSDF